LAASLGNTNLSDVAKKCQQAFLTPLPGLECISILGDCAKKCQQAFLAPLPGMESISILVIALRNANDGLDEPRVKSCVLPFVVEFVPLLFELYF